MQLAALTVHIPSTAAGTADEWYVAWPFAGTWRPKKVMFAPATGVAAGATNFTTVTITANDGAGGADSSPLASFTTDAGGTSLVLKTTIDLTLGNLTVTEMIAGRQLKIAKVESGTGDILDGTFTFLYEKIN